MHAHYLHHTVIPDITEGAMKQASEKKKASGCPERSHGRFLVLYSLPLNCTDSFLCMYHLSIQWHNDSSGVFSTSSLMITNVRPF